MHLCQPTLSSSARDRWQGSTPGTCYDMSLSSVGQTGSRRHGLPATPPQAAPERTLGTNAGAGPSTSLSALALPSALNSHLPAEPQDVETESPPAQLLRAGTRHPSLLCSKFRTRRTVHTRVGPDHSGHWHSKSPAQGGERGTPGRGGEGDKGATSGLFALCR